MYTPLSSSSPTITIILLWMHANAFALDPFDERSSFTMWIRPGDTHSLLHLSVTVTFTVADTGQSGLRDDRHAVHWPDPTSLSTRVNRMRVSLPTVLGALGCDSCARGKTTGASIPAKPKSCHYIQKLQTSAL